MAQHRPLTHIGDVWLTKPGSPLSACLEKEGLLPMLSRYIGKPAKMILVIAIPQLACNPSSTYSTTALLCVLDYFIFANVLRRKAKKGLYGNVLQVAAEGVAPGQPREVPLIACVGQHSHGARGLHKDTGSPPQGRLPRELINAWRDD